MIAVRVGMRSAPLVRASGARHSGSSQTLVLRADLHGLHSDFGLGPRFEDAVVNDCSGRGGEDWAAAVESLSPQETLPAAAQALNYFSHLRPTIMLAGALQRLLRRTQRLPK
jgi:hypothetical protein